MIGYEMASGKINIGLDKDDLDEMQRLAKRLSVGFQLIADGFAEVCEALGEYRPVKGEQNGEH